jgi:TonB family protein
VDILLDNTTRNPAATISEKITVEAPSKASEKLELKVKSDDSKKQLSEVVVAGKKEKDVASEEFALKKSSKLDNANEKLSNRSLPNSAPSAVGVFRDNEYKKDTTNYSRLNIFKGRVTDAFNNGIPFANVTISDVNVGTYADAKGYFNLVAPDTTLDVSLRAVGFNNSQMRLRNSLPTNEVVLQEDRSLNAIVMNNNKPNASRSRSSTMVLTEPEPSDGWENYDSYLANNLVVPEESERQQKKGEVEVAFEVNSKGEPVNIKVTKSLCKECDEEAIRLVKDGPRWKKKNKKEKAKVTVSF